MMTSTSEMSGNASRGMCCMDQTLASTSRSVPVKTKKGLRAHHSIQRLITLHASLSIDGHDLGGDRLPAFLCGDRHVPPLPRLPVASYMPPPLSLSITTVRMADMPMAGMAGIKNVTVTLAPSTGLPSAPVSLTRSVLFPL